VKLVQLTDEGDKPIVVNADAVCFLRRYTPDRMEIHILGETSTIVRGTGIVDRLEGRDARKPTDVKPPR
jgi:hypothetical protein